MTLDFVQIATNVLVGAISGLVAGKFSVRIALEKSRKEKAFDRCLDGYEKTFRIMSRFRSSISDFVLGFHLRDLSEHADLLKALEKTALEAEDCVSEAALFAEPAVVKKLADVRLRVRKTVLDIQDINPPNLEEEKELVKTVFALGKSMAEITLMMAQKFRGHLNLAPITGNDLISENRPPKDN
jgi:hypothetical protein